MRPDYRLSRFVFATVIRQRRDRRGAVTLWTILSLPALLLVLFLVADSVHLWVARVELETALEAAALAAVKGWGMTNGAEGTLVPRQIGVEFAAANTINGQSVVITDNYSSSNSPNHNASCTGNLIFGAVERITGPPCLRYTFDASEEPSCGGGTVLFDASGQGNLHAGDNDWGIAFQRDANTPASGFLIHSVSINLGTGNDMWFDVGDLQLADLIGPFKVRDNSGHSQPDRAGFLSPSNQIHWAYSGISPSNSDRAKVLTFTFSAYNDPYGPDDAGFEPCDRFRFGQLVGRLSGAAQYDGDDIGHYGVTVTIVFSQGGVLLPPVTAVFVNSGIDLTCSYQGTDSYCPSSIIVSPYGVPDLPCPPVPGQGANPDGQSFVLTYGGGGRHGFGVRAQATIPVTSLLCRFWGNVFGPYSVSACATAFYDCREERSRLIRVEAGDYTCP